jgi:hypothetical protein
MESEYKILSLDGGGSWAILQVLALKDMFKAKYPDKEIKGHEVLRHFDLVIANSGGSMVLAALACNWTFDEIVGLFEKEQIRNSIFKKLSFRERYFPANFIRLFGVKSIGSRYSTTNKRKALGEILKIDNSKKLESVLLSELPGIIGKESLQIIVATFDIITKRAKLFRSNKNSNARAEKAAGLSYFDEINLVEAIHGSSNAPVNYFDFPAVFSPEDTRSRFYLWDGALGGFNNPVMAGLTEALANGIKKEQVRILSIGTGSKLVSTADTKKFRDSYYSTLLGKKIERNKETEEIDFERTNNWFTWLGRIKKPKLFFRMFKGAGFFADTISNLSQSILFEPQSWATYSAYINLFSENIEAPENNTNFIRISPQIIINNTSGELIKKLYKLDMDVTKQEDIELIKTCFTEWKKGTIINEPVQWEKTIHDEYVFAKGHRTLKEAFNDMNWL